MTTQDTEGESRFVLSVFHAFMLSSLYVVSLYMWKGSLASSRNDPKQIRRRSIAVLVSSLVSIVYCFIVNYWFLDRRLVTEEESFLSVMGIDFSHFGNQILSIMAALFLNSCLFLGPIVEDCNIQTLVGSGSNVTFGTFVTNQSRRMTRDAVKMAKSIFEVTKQFPNFLLDEETNIVYFENGMENSEAALFNFRSIVMGPLTEEIVFRSCLYYLLHYYGGWTMMNSILISGFFFGVAHCHHIVEHLLHGDMTIMSAILNVVVQFSYTFVFGLYCGYIYGKTKCIIAAMILHSYCNLMGLPSFDMRKPIIAASYVVGLVSFWVLLFPVLSLVSY